MDFVFQRRHILTGIGIIVFATLAAIYVASHHDVVRESLPEKLSDVEFWNLINELSEAGGYFRSDNFVSNESAFQHVIVDHMLGQGVTLPEPKNLTIDGHPAVQYVFPATVSGINAHMWITLVDGKNGYYHITAWTLASRKDANARVLEQVVTTFHERG